MRKEIVVLGMCLLLGFNAGAQLLHDSAVSYTAIKKITLHSTSGKKVKIQAPKEALLLFVMLSPECPLCKNYSLMLNRLQTKYKDSMQVVGIVPGKAYSGTDVQQFAADYKIKFPLLIDKEKELSLYLKTSVTPEVVLTNAAGQTIYRGAIDDWMEELGKKKVAPQQHYLDEAITQYLAGTPVLRSSTIAKGCLINEF
jgi:thiol-disulfide isomerase/thioredoxin